METPNNPTNERLPLMSGSKPLKGMLIISTAHVSINVAENDTPTNDALLEITSYRFLRRKRWEHIYYNVGKYVLLTTISGTSVWLYGATGGLAAGNDLALRILLVMGGVVTNFCVTFNTSEAFIEYMESKQVPVHLKKYMKKESDKLEMAIIGTTAILSAGPITMAVFNKAGKITFLIITEASITQIDNTFLHTFIMMIISKSPILRKLFSLPFIPLILGYHLMNRLCSTDEEIHFKKVRAIKERKHAEIKKTMINTLEIARNQILVKSIQRRKWKKFGGLAYDVKLPGELNNLSDFSSISAIIKITSYAPVIEKTTPQSLCSKIGNFMLDSVLGTGFYLFGVGFSNLGSAGFYKNALDDFDFFKNPTDAWALSTSPNLLLIVLVSYFAGNFFRDTLFNNIVSCFKRQYQPPHAFKLYPKTILLLTSLAIFFARYSYGTALYLVQKHFADPEFDDIRPLLIFCATYGLPIFTFKNTLEFILKQTVRFAKNFGDDDKKASAVLDDTILKIKNSIQNMDGEELEKSLQLRTPEERASLLRMSESEFQQLVDQSIIEAEANVTELEIRVTSPLSPSLAYLAK